MIKYRLFIVFLTLFINANIFAFITFPKAVLSVDKDGINIGDTINAEVEIFIPPFVKILQTEDDFFVDGWDIQNFHFKKDVKEEGKYILNIQITTYDERIKEIPQIQFSYINSGETLNNYSEKFHFFSNSVPVTVKSIFADEQFNNIRDIKYVKILSIPVLYYALAVIFIFFIIFVVYKDILYSKILKIITIKSFTPKEIAIRKLNNLYCGGNFQKEQIVQCYCSLSDILKKFIQSVLKIESVEMTTTELLLTIANKDNIFNKDYSEIAYLFKFYDNTKYSSANLDQNSLVEFLKKTKDFIERQNINFDIAKGD